MSREHTAVSVPRATRASTRPAVAQAIFSWRLIRMADQPFTSISAVRRDCLTSSSERSESVSAAGDVTGAFLVRVNRFTRADFNGKTPHCNLIRGAWGSKFQTLPLTFDLNGNYLQVE